MNRSRGAGRLWNGQSTPATRLLRTLPELDSKLKLTAELFGSPELDHDTEIVLAMATVSTEGLVPIGRSFNPPYEADVFWMPTEKHPNPTDKWLEEFVPSESLVVSGFRNAFEQYIKDWCGDQMRDELLASLSGEKLETFRNDGWLPFVIPDPIYINPDARVMVYKCMCHIDYNLEEHGVEVSYHDGDWKFGYIGDNMESFEYWGTDG